MKRLTIKGATEPVCARKCEYGSSLDCYDCDKHKELLNRLAAYEDTGLEPDEVKEITSWSYGPFHKKMGDWLKAEHEGRLVVLPCKVGDEFYRIEKYCDDGNDDREMTVHSMSDCEYFCGKESCDCEKRPTLYTFTSVERILSAEKYIGKTVFLTRAEAEAAMKGVSEDA